jgi:hypothetical protein
MSKLVTFVDRRQSQCAMRLGKNPLMQGQHDGGDAVHSMNTGMTTDMEMERNQGTTIQFLPSKAEPQFVAWGG